MPPKPKITKDMVIDAAFTIARDTGAEQINARTVSERLNCSTQPVMYHFATIAKLKQAAYAKANLYHSEYLLNVSESKEGILLGIGINYIRFAVEEPHLFRFLFQSGYAAENSLLEMIDAEELAPVLSTMQKAMHMNLAQTKEIFITLSMFVHGYASIIANHSLEYEEELIKQHLKRVYTGAVLAAQKENER
ncbi:MAG: TetR/AcrR family transcriptional regulator [Lachnospiraceae bacterium]|nr:TetR/AcrR family transcriptional regulator [Lachnospiraceae bacterium]